MISSKGGMERAHRVHTSASSTTVRWLCLPFYFTAPPDERSPVARRWEEEQMRPEPRDTKTVHATGIGLAHGPTAAITAQVQQRRNHKLQSHDRV